MTSRRLIVSADDFGLGAAVDRGIVAAAARRSVTSVGVIANLVEAASVAELVAAAPAVSLGVHLNLTTGRPLSPAREIPSLVGADGMFHPLARLTRLAFAGRVRGGEVARELAAQVARVQALDVAIDHLDSHEHVHLLPGVTGAVIDLARSAGGQRMRTHRPRILGPRWTGPPRYYARHPRRVATHALKRLLAFRLRIAGIATPDGMVAPSLLVTPVPGGPPDEWAAIAAMLPPGTWELVVHPADLEVTPRPGDVERLGELVARRGAELAALVDPHFHTMIAATGVELVPFAAIPTWTARMRTEERYVPRRA
jgi:predicted glycoside hydrolase/deacetylase ChbG (UPF0249 family)